MKDNEIVWRLFAATPYGLEDENLLVDAAHEIERLNSMLLLAAGLLSTYKPWTAMHPTQLLDILTKLESMPRE